MLSRYIVFHNGNIGESVLPPRYITIGRNWSHPRALSASYQDQSYERKVLVLADAVVGHMLVVGH